MTNKDYNILGKIISLITNDYPPQMSNKFADKVMDKIYLQSVKNHKKTSNNYLNIAASIFFAVITSYTLVNYNNEMDANNTPLIVDDMENKENNLVRRVIDKNPCEIIDNSNSNDDDNDSCKQK